MTIKDIAGLSGYSVGTVSRVLNSSPNVSNSAAGQTHWQMLPICPTSCGVYNILRINHFRGFEAYYADV